MKNKKIKKYKANRFFWVYSIIQMCFIYRKKHCVQYAIIVINVQVTISLTAAVVKLLLYVLCSRKIYRPPPLYPPTVSEDFWEMQEMEMRKGPFYKFVIILDPVHSIADAV